jgi:hypothetical protein
VNEITIEADVDEDEDTGDDRRGRSRGGHGGGGLKKLIMEAADEACASGRAGDEQCLCARVVTTNFDTAYLRACGTCEMKLEFTDRRDIMDQAKDIQKEIRDKLDDA